MAEVSGAEPYQPAMTEDEKRQVVEASVGERVKLSEYRPTVTDLTPEERELLIDQAILMLEQVYVHLPLKRAMHSTEPIQRLRLLRLRHTALNERAFQSTLIDIFTDLRDGHTTYTLPESYGTRHAFLPFRIEEYYESVPDGEPIRRFVVSVVSPLNQDPNLKEGVEVTHWNGSPVELAVARNAEREIGGNVEARRARGIERLTLRWFGASLPPDEDWVVLTYKDGETIYETKFFWEVIDAKDRPKLLPERLSDAQLDQAGEDTELGIDLKTDLLYRVRTALFDPVATKVGQEVAERRAAAADGVSDAAAADGPPPAAASEFPEVFPRFGEVTTPSGTFGYIRLKTFRPDPQRTIPRLIDRVVDEFERILGLMPSSGLILDVRGNAGGTISFGERILQMLTPRRITPAPFHFLATPLTHLISKLDGPNARWRDAIGQAIETGASYSQGFPMTSEERCNSIGQRYQGPVVLITDALCYSTTDIFAAAFQDHEIGTILGCHKNTGAGGANVWNHVANLEPLSLPPGSTFVPLPQQADMQVAIRRSTRIGKRSGVPVEDLGVEPDVPYLMSRRDVLEHNVDLIAKAASLLAEKQPTQTLKLKPFAAAPVRVVAYECENIDRIDLFVDDRPMGSPNVTGSGGEIELPVPAEANSVVVANGYRGAKLVASTRRTV